MIYVAITFRRAHTCIVCSWYMTMQSVLFIYTTLAHSHISFTSSLKFIYSHSNHSNCIVYIYIHTWITTSYQSTHTWKHWPLTFIFFPRKYINCIQILRLKKIWCMWSLCLPFLIKVMLMCDSACLSLRWHFSCWHQLKLSIQNILLWHVLLVWK